MSKKRFTRQERKTIKKFKSLVASGNHRGRMRKHFTIDEPFPLSVFREVVSGVHRIDTKKREIPLRVKGERENENDSSGDDYEKDI